MNLRSRQRHAQHVAVVTGGRSVVALAVIGSLASLASSACIHHPPAATPPPAPPPFAATVTIVPGERHQTLEGFGASVAWHQDKIVGDKAPDIYKILFPELG